MDGSVGGSVDLDDRSVTDSSTGAGTSGSGSTVGGRVGGVMDLGGDGGGMGYLGALARSLQLGGQSGLVLRLLMASLARKAAKGLGVTNAGQEFVAARIAADELAPEWCEESVAARIAADELGAQAGLDAELIERMKDDDAISSFFQQLSLRYPALLGPLIHERDMYLAWSLKRSKAVNGASQVVGVVGRGHMRGVVYALTCERGTLRFSDLVGPRNKAKKDEAIKRLVIETGLFGLAWWAWTTFSEGGFEGSL
eukprot:gene5568-4203_t